MNHILLKTSILSVSSTETSKTQVHIRVLGQTVFSSSCSVVVANAKLWSEGVFEN